MGLDLERYNGRVKQWQRETVASAKAAAIAMNVQHRSYSTSAGPSVNKISGRIRMKDGVADKVSIRYPRQLIWTQKGAGKGRGGSSGSRWIDKYGNTKKTNPASLGKMGTGGRTAKPFLSDTLDGPAGVDHLATIAAEEMGTTFINSLFKK